MSNARRRPPPEGRLLPTTAHQMAVADCELGLATLCIGGGQGGAAVLERIA